MERTIFCRFFIPFLLLVGQTRWFYVSSAQVTPSDEHEQELDSEYAITFEMLQREKESDSLGFEAIKQLHRQMDDDHSGTIDVTESTEFLREELQISEKERIGRRQKAFHVNNDKFITVDDLWHKWVMSEERKWTVDETLDWLVNYVELPQYVETFQKNAVDGQAVARMAIQNTSFLNNILGIQNPVHRQKFQLKAMDVVLFGYRKPVVSQWKDILLAVTVLGSVSLILFYRYQRSKAQKEMGQLAAQMDQLKNMEIEFQETQRKFDDENPEKSEEIDVLKKSLEEAERRLERERESGSLGYAPLALQPLLRKTCELEVARMHQERLDGLKEMKEAMEMVEKLRRKQSSLVSSLKLAVASSGTETVDQRISAIKLKMEKTAKVQNESQQRWVQIESLCGFPLVGINYPTGSVSLNQRGRPILNRPASLNGLTHLPFALTSALAAVPNAYRGLVRPTLLSPMTIDEREENGAFVQSVPGQLYPSPPSRSSSYVENAYVAASVLQVRSPTSESLSSGRHHITHQSTTTPNERPYFQVGDQQFDNSLRARHPHLRENGKAESQDSSNSSNASEEQSKTGSKKKNTFNPFKKRK